MAKRKRKQGSIPKRKRLNRKQRLRSARSWLRTYEGDNIAKGYRKRFGVDWPTAFKELDMLGVPVDPEYKKRVLQSVQGQAAAKRRKKAEKAAELERTLDYDQDDHFAYIVGYTSGGAPYGLTWEEWEELEESGFEE